MIRFETVNELALKVTCQGGGVLYTKAGAFIAGESAGGKNYTCLLYTSPSPRD